jgi:hypothetical protein
MLPTRIPAGSASRTSPSATVRPSAIDSGTPSTTSRAPHGFHLFVSAEPCVGADVDQCAGEQADSRHLQARALIRVRDELESDRGEELVVAHP